MNIVFDARMVDSSGIGTYIQNILKGLSPEYKIIALGDEKRLSSFTELKDVIPFKTPIYSVQEQYDLPRLIPSCDYFWSPHYNVPLLPVRAKRRIVSIYDAYHKRFPGSLAERAYAHFVMKAALKRSAKVITISQFSKKEFIHYFKDLGEKAHVIHPGVDGERFNPRHDLQAQLALRRKYQLPEKFVLAVGNVKPHKNFGTLVKALTGSPFPLVVVGQREGLRTFDNTLLQSPNALFTGRVADEEVPLFYALAACFVFPSLYEGFGFPVLEAMASSCPVVTSREASLPEVAGEGACYIDPRDPAGIRRSVADIFADSGYSMRLQAYGLKRAAMFSWAECCRQHKEFLATA